MLLPPRLRRLRPRTLLRVSRPLPLPVRRKQHSGRLSQHAGAVFPRPAPADEAQFPQAADSDDAQGQLARRRLHADRSDRRHFPSVIDDPNNPPARSRTPAAAVQRKDLFRPRNRPQAPASRTSPSSASSSYIPTPKKNCRRSSPNTATPASRWVQEEPKNRGAWTFMSDRLEPMLPETAVLKYFGRDEAASPAVGSKKSATQEEAEIISRALELPVAGNAARKKSPNPPKPGRAATGKSRPGLGRRRGLNPKPRKREGRSDAYPGKSSRSRRIGETSQAPQMAQAGRANRQRVDEPICELESDKANVDVPAESAGVIHPKKREGKWWKSGEVIAEIDPIRGKIAKPAAVEKKPAAAPRRRRRFGSPIAATSIERFTAPPFGDCWRRIISILSRSPRRARRIG
jgi:hypothetical protein